MASLIENFICESAGMKQLVGLAVDKKSKILIDFGCNICKSLVFDPLACSKCD